MTTCDHRLLESDCPRCHEFLDESLMSLANCLAAEPLSKDVRTDMLERMIMIKEIIARGRGRPKRGEV